MFKIGQIVKIGNAVINTRGIIASKKDDDDYYTIEAGWGYELIHETEIRALSDKNWN